MNTRMWQFVCAVSLSMLAGCAGTGEMIPIHLTPLASKAETLTKPAPIRVAVAEFTDGRAHKTGLGVRTHLWGGVSYFDVPGGKPTAAAAQALRQFLSAKGWQVVPVEATGPSPDVMVSGTVVDLTLKAKSGVGFTDITTSERITLQATNVADGSTVHMTLNGTGFDSVFWFTPDDAQVLINDVLTDSFAKILLDTIVANNVLRLK